LDFNQWISYFPWKIPICSNPFKRRRRRDHGLPAQTHT
jgi:hypothetical protein